MRHAFSSPFLAGSLVAVLAMLPGCSGSGSSDSASVGVSCLGGQSFCIVSCDLGCSQTGCSISEIAENQRIHFKFSDRVEPSTVNGSSLSIRTATGVAPEGDYLVNGAEVTFVPRVRTINGVSTFGFQRNESYIITLAGGPTRGQGVRSVDGDSLDAEFSCTIRATLGIRDEDQQPPTAELVSPTSFAAIPRDPTFVLRFSELIDTTPLLAPLSDTSPVRVVLRRTTGTGECDFGDAGIVLEGLPTLTTERVNGHDVTVMTYRPSVQLPGLACVIVQVTQDVRDLSGRPATPIQFEMFTEQGVPQSVTVTEAFTSPTGQDPLVSGGVWSNGARPGVIGGDGRHGSFNPIYGQQVGPNEFIWNLDTPGITIPGQPAPITNGVFFFTDFIVGEGVTVRFRGSVPAQIYVRGRAEIRGTLDLSGSDLPSTAGSGVLAGQRVSTFDAQVLGQQVVQNGSAGGAGGGRGGNGGSKSPGVAPVPATADGQNGVAVQPLPTHAYAGSAGGTGGVGSLRQHSSGLTAQAGTPFIQTFTSTVNIRDEFSRGGSGGGYMAAGGAPLLPSIPPFGSTTTPTQPNAGPAVPGGAAFALLPFPATPPPGYQSFTHFLVGGSGGGGGGSHPFGSQSPPPPTTPPPDVWSAGHAGTGGGGAVGVRAGSDVVVPAGGSILAKGGRGVVITGDDPAVSGLDINYGVSSPGGGGSGGSIVLQSGRTVNIQGALDTSGGEGCKTAAVAAPLGMISAPLAPNGPINVRAQGGTGSNGFYRLEALNNVTVNTTLPHVPSYDPAVNTGPLNDRDTASGDLSRWRGTGLVFAPTWLRYELDVDVDGDGTIDTVYTDSGAPGTLLANDPSGPVTLRFQGARINQAGNAPIEGTVRPWRDRVNGNEFQTDGATGFRFELIYNRGAFPNQVVRGLRVFAQS